MRRSNQVHGNEYATRFSCKVIDLRRMEDGREGAIETWRWFASGAGRGDDYSLMLTLSALAEYKEAA